MAKRKAQGLGDTIDQITTATGIKALVKFVAGEDCGCDQRKEALNKLFPYSKPNCLSEQDYNFLKEFFPRKATTVQVTDVYRLMDIYKNVFGKQLEFPGCGSCFDDRINELKKVFDQYVQENDSSQQNT
jgi:hypothetical protein